MSRRKKDTLDTCQRLPSAESLLPLTLGWWNGRHVRLRGVCRKACGFKSRPEQNSSSHQISWLAAVFAFLRSNPGSPAGLNPDRKLRPELHRHWGARFPIATILSSAGAGEENPKQHSKNWSGKNVSHGESIQYFLQKSRGEVPNGVKIAAIAAWTDARVFASCSQP